MELNFSENLKKELEKGAQKINHSIIGNVELELAEKLDAIQEFSIDRIEENIIVLENRKNGEIVNLEKSLLPSNIKEGDILKCINGKYMLDIEKTKDETRRIRGKMDGLWN